MFLLMLASLIVRIDGSPGPQQHAWRPSKAAWSQTDSPPAIVLLNRVYDSPRERLGHKKQSPKETKTKGQTHTVATHKAQGQNGQGQIRTQASFKSAHVVSIPVLQIIPGL